MDSRYVSSVRERFEQGDSGGKLGVENAHPPKSPSSPRSILNRRLQDHLSGGGGGVGASNPLMIASPDNPVGLTTVAKRSSAPARRILDKEQQAQVADIASQVAQAATSKKRPEADRKANDGSSSNGKPTRSSPKWPPPSPPPPPRTRVDPDAPKPKILPKPPRAKPRTKPRTTSESNSDDSNTTAAAAAAAKAEATPPISRSVVEPETANSVQLPPISGGVVEPETANSVQLRVSREFRASASLSLHHRLTTIEDRTPEGSPEMIRRGKVSSRQVLEPDEDDGLSSDDEGEENDAGGGGAMDEGNVVVVTKTSSVKERAESTLSDGIDVNDATLQAKLFKIAQELCTTEKTYVMGLELLVKGFRETVLEANQSSAKPLVPDREVAKIFSSLPEIYQLNLKLLGDLEERIANWESFRRIGDIMAQFAPFLKMYATYTADFEDAMRVLDEWRRKETRFADLLKRFQARPECRNLAISHFMLEPVQRIPRYKMLLESYLKRLPDDSPDKPDTEKALHNIAEAADRANNRMKELEEFEKIMEVQRSLAENLSLVIPGRIFLKEGFLNKCSRRGFNRRKFFLFNDILLYCSSTAAGFKIKRKIGLAGLKIEIPVVADIPNCFSVISREEKSFMVSASSQEERDDWFQTISAAIKQLDKKLLSLKRQSSFLTSSNEVGTEAPVWLPDKSASMCMECGKLFTALRRRHHCRGCGRILCSECSKNKAYLKFLKREDRVCNLCFCKLRGMKFRDETEPVAKQSSSVKNIKAYTEDAQKMGYLYVKRGLKGGWIRQWFQLKDNILYSFRAHEDVKALSTNPLLGYRVERMPEGSIKEKDFVIKVGHQSEGLSFYLEAESNDECSKWLDALKKASELNF